MTNTSFTESRALDAAVEYQCQLHNLRREAALAVMERPVAAPKVFIEKVQVRNAKTTKRA